MIKPYELLDEDVEGNQLIKLTSNKFSGIIYTYGRVRLLEEDDQLRVQFEYDVQENPVGIIDASEFRNHIGDILIDLLEENLLKNNLVYTGGTDADRTTNSEQFDSQ